MVLYVDLPEVEYTVHMIKKRTDHLAALRFGLQREELERPLHAQELRGVPVPQRVQLGLLQRRLQRPPLGVEAQDALQQRVRPDRQSVK